MIDRNGPEYAQLEQLRKVALSEQAYKDYRNTKRQHHLAFIASNDSATAKLDLVNDSSVHSSVILDSLNIKAGSSPSSSQINVSV